MQYMNLKDRNEAEIYEADIIRYTSFDGKEYTQVCPDMTHFHFWQETADNDTVEVIGNIYENKVLLNAKRP